MQNLIPSHSDASETEMRMFLSRLDARIGDADLSKDQVDRILAFGYETRAAVLERRARRLERLLTVASSLLGDPTSVSHWLRLPNSGLGGAAPLDAILGDADALGAICSALVDEHRTVFRDGGW